MQSQIEQSNLSPKSISTSISNHFLQRIGTMLDHICGQFDDPNLIVKECAPELQKLITHSPNEVNDLIDHLHWPDPHDTSYTRQRLLESSHGSWSVYGICWQPGQYTPIHDHGTWGVVGIIRGCLHEHSMTLIERDDIAQYYRLIPTGISLLSEGSVNTFLPEPDHIHLSGIPKSSDPTVSLHLYGRVMTHYYAYDLTSHTRSRLDVE